MKIEYEGKKFVPAKIVGHNYYVDFSKIKNLTIKRISLSVYDKEDLMDEWKPCFICCVVDDDDGNLFHAVNTHNYILNKLMGLCPPKIEIL